MSTSAPDEADGLLKRQYDAVEERAGNVYQIVQSTGLFAYCNRLAGGPGIDVEPEWATAR